MNLQDLGNIGWLLYRILNSLSDVPRKTKLLFDVADVTLYTGYSTFHGKFNFQCHLFDDVLDVVGTAITHLESA